MAVQFSRLGVCAPRFLLMSDICLESGGRALECLILTSIPSGIKWAAAGFRLRWCQAEQDFVEAIEVRV